MRKLYEIFKVLKIQKRIVSAEIIRGNKIWYPKLIVINNRSHASAHTKVSSRIS